MRTRSAASLGTGTAVRLAAVPVLLFLAVVLTGCATYTDKFVDLRPQLAKGEFDAALETVEKEAGDKEQLLYHLERGLILHYADRWTESNEEFANAEFLATLTRQAQSEGTNGK